MNETSYVDITDHDSETSCAQISLTDYVERRMMDLSVDDGEGNGEDNGEDNDKDSSERSGEDDSGKDSGEDNGEDGRVDNDQDDSETESEGDRTQRRQRVGEAAQNVPFETKIALAGKGRGKIVRLRVVVSSHRTQGEGGSSK
ncbi:unnamed protein product [Phytophthora fragariaefolia]|uniref:Unnamed protein product n=1 Tax=Phytophthora fragariaefolia TaxID=1490495 RepID=A0A9W6YG30_9STRA|nr:unnamed protein product [Phytophthora fragariaefolia]